MPYIFKVALGNWAMHQNQMKIKVEKIDTLENLINGSKAEANQFIP